jgi:hypothetical protein
MEFNLRLALTASILAAALIMPTPVLAQALKPPLQSDIGLPLTMANVC